VQRANWTLRKNSLRQSRGIDILLGQVEVCLCDRSGGGRSFRQRRSHLRRPGWSVVPLKGRVGGPFAFSARKKFASKKLSPYRFISRPCSANTLWLINAEIRRSSSSPRRFTENPCAAAVCFGVSEFQERFTELWPLSAFSRIQRELKVPTLYVTHDQTEVLSMSASS
jgi:hypothetical protein